MQMTKEAFLIIFSLYVLWGIMNSEVLMDIMVITIMLAGAAHNVIQIKRLHNQITQRK